MNFCNRTSSVQNIEYMKIVYFQDKCEYIRGGKACEMGFLSLSTSIWATLK